MQTHTYTTNNVVYVCILICRVKWFEEKGLWHFISSWVAKQKEKQLRVAFLKYKYIIPIAMSYESRWVSPFLLPIKLDEWRAGEVKYFLKNKNNGKQID